MKYRLICHYFKLRKKYSRIPIIYTRGKERYNLFLNIVMKIQLLNRNYENYSLILL